MKKSTRVIITSTLLLTSFAFGRYTTPVKIVKEVETKIVEVIKETKNEDSKTDTKKSKKVEKVVTETTYPDGKKVVETHYVEVSDTDRKSEKDSETVVDKDTKSDSKSTETITKDSGRVHLSVIAGANLSDLKSSVLGGHIQKSVLGPVTVGVWGLSVGTGGVSVGLLF